MNRRTYLTGVAVGLVGAPGCGGVRGPFSGPNNERGTVLTPDDPCTILIPDESPVPVSANTDSYVMTYPSPPRVPPMVEVVAGEVPTGSAEEPRCSIALRVENETVNLFEVTVTLFKGSNAATEVFTTTCDLEPIQYFAVALVVPATYELRVNTDEDVGPTLLPIPRDFFGGDTTCQVNIRDATIDRLCGGPDGGGGGDSPDC